jgi:hypothetical protein
VATGHKSSILGNSIVAIDGHCRNNCDGAIAILVRKKKPCKKGAKLMPAESSPGAAVGGSQRFEIRLGHDESFNETVMLTDPVPTGRQILAASGRRPEKDYQLLLLTKDGDLEEIGLDETIDLRDPRVEQFFAFRTDRLFSFVIDDRRFPWGASEIPESTLKFLARVPAEYTVWLEQHGAQEDLRIETGTSAPLGGKGVEVFFTGKDQTNAGNGLDLLPSEDRRYLAGHDLHVEVVKEGGQLGIIFRNYRLPPGVFDVDTCDLLVLLPGGYPDAPPDMFYAHPWLKLKGGDRYPNAADQPHEFASQRWQRWSRHNNEWRPGTDFLRTFVQRMTTALEAAA